jgi:2-phosphosulfolactate phosphatase
VRVSVLLVPGTKPLPRDTTAVVIDVLRATTTLTVALASGAERVIPAETLEEARRLRDRTPGALLCGERDGRKVGGFDLGNSPSEYPAEVVRGRTLVFASTNGSAALKRAETARRRVLGCFANADAVVSEVAGEENVTIVCAGKLGRTSLEDAGFAGWLCRRLEAGGARLENDAARFAVSLAPRDAGDTLALVEGSSHGRYLRSLGGEFARDVRFAAALNSLSQVFWI